jgi:hypothetical protein
MERILTMLPGYEETIRTARLDAGRRLLSFIYASSTQDDAVRAFPRWPLGDGEPQTLGSSRDDRRRGSVS